MTIHRSMRCALIMVLAVMLVPLLASPGHAQTRKAPIEPQVLNELQAQDRTSVWVVLDEQADLSPAYAMDNWAARGQWVYDELQRVATRSQAPLRARLTQQGVAHQSFFIVNTVQVEVDQALLDELAVQPDVKEIKADVTFELPNPTPGTEQAQSAQQAAAVEWNIARIRAPEVWSTYGTRGEGIVVATIDGGVKFDHAALVQQYRGNKGNGTFDHNYNWFDTIDRCTSSPGPCDTHGHGTHVTGIMVGAANTAGAPQIGVAPGAKWIATNGCVDFACTYASTMAAAQWVLAPTKLDGTQPRPDLRPHVVNNSWGSTGFSFPEGGEFPRSAVQAWVAAGIFPTVAAGNSGRSGCNTMFAAPGYYPESYSVGAFDAANAIADFSARGPSTFDGSTMPSIAAPGVNIRSSFVPNHTESGPGGEYVLRSGTSMAAPHVAGTVALLWAAAPGLIGDVAGTRAILDQTAIDVADLQCGGTADKNNVWGEGRLDALAAVQRARSGAPGMLKVYFPSVMYIK